MRSFYFTLLILILSLSGISPQAQHRDARVFYFGYQPDPWEIEDIGEKRFKPYDDENKNNVTLRGSIKKKESCFGNGEGDYRLVTFTDLKLDSLGNAVRDQFNLLLDKYLSKYCTSETCRVNYEQNKFVCTDKDGYNHPEAGRKDITSVLKLIGVYLKYQKDKFKLGGKKKPIEDGKPCVQPPYKLLFDQEPTNDQQKKLDKKALEFLGPLCKSERCYYDYSSKTFLCRSSSFQPMAALIATLLVLTFGHLNYQY